MTNTTLSEIIKPAHDLVDEKEAAEFLSITPGTLSVWRSLGRYNIPFIKVGARVRYSRKVLEAWLESRTCANGATPASNVRKMAAKQPAPKKTRQRKSKSSATA